MGANVHIHPLLPFLILLVPEPLMVKRPVVRAGQCQENAREYQDTIETLEATLQKGLEMGIHKEVPTALAEGTRNSKSRFKEERPRTQGIDHIA